MFNLKQLTGQDPSPLEPLPDCFCSSEAAGPKPLAHPQAIVALLELHEQATKEQQPFQVLSGYRDFEQQKSIWNRKFQGKTTVFDAQEEPIDVTVLTSLETIKAIMLYSALPGASRHHWGTDFDIFPSTNLPVDYQPQLLASEFSTDGVAGKFNLWLTEALNDSPFFLPYLSFNRGIAAEPWHISYQPVAETALEALTVETLLELYSDTASPTADIAGRESIYENLEALYYQFIRNICRP